MSIESERILHKSLARIGKKNTEEILPNDTQWKDLTTILLHVFGNRIKEISPAEIMRHYQDNRLTSVSEIDQKVFNYLDSVFYKSIPSNFSAVEISPVTPIGTNYVLTGLDPKTTISTTRQSDVQSDSSVALALECASRKRKNLGVSNVHLATSHRIIRAQKYSADSGFSPHFRAFAMASSGKDKGMGEFFMGSIGSHIESWLNFLNHFKKKGVGISTIRVHISNVAIVNTLIEKGLIDKNVLQKSNGSDSLFHKSKIALPSQAKSMSEVPLLAKCPELETHIRILQHFENTVVHELRKSFPSVEFVFDLERVHGAGYYSDLCYGVYAYNDLGDCVPLADGGVTDWMKKLLSSKKEHFVTSGFGAELFAKSFLQ